MEQSSVNTAANDAGIAQSEWRWIWIFSAIILVITSLPYLVGFIMQGEAWRFTGFLFGAEDGNSYIAKMLSGAAGNWLFRTPYTAYPQKGFLAFLPYILLGKLTFGLSSHTLLVSLFQIYRLAGAAAYIAATYAFLALFVGDIRLRRMGTVLATLGGGLGWLTIFGLKTQGYAGLPLEFYSPETFGFLSILGLPHLAFARAFLLWGLRAYLVSPGRAWTWQTGVKTGALWVGLGLMQPLTVVVGWAVLGAHLLAVGLWQLWQQRSGQSADGAIWRSFFIRALWMGALSTPLALYNAFSFLFDPFLKTWQSQNIITSPPPLDYLLAFAVILPLSLLGIRPALKPLDSESSTSPWQGWLLVAWLILFPLLAYAPYNLQRRLPEGIWVVLVALAMLSLQGAGERLRRWAPRWLWLAYPATIIFALGSLMVATAPKSPLFLPVEEAKAFEYLANNAKPGQVVLAAFDTSNPLPAWAPVRTLTGHGPESVNGPVILKHVTCFYSTCSESERTWLLDEFRVNYVVWGPLEHALGSWDPSTNSSLRQVYHSGEYQIFRYQNAH